MKRAQVILDLEFKAPGAEIGWFYPSVDTDGEGDRDAQGGQLLENGELDMVNFRPSTIPGHHLPHVWVSKGGKTIALRDLIPLSKLLLLADDPRWASLESELVHVEIIGEHGWKDSSGEWQRLANGKPTVLVRPDGIIAWRGVWSEEVPGSWNDILEKALCVKS